MAALTIVAASMPEVGANGTVGDTASTPTVKSFDGVKSTKNSNGSNSAGYYFTGGSGLPATVGSDTASNADLLLGVGSSKASRLYKFLSSKYATQADLDKAAAALGVIVAGTGIAGARFLTAGNAVPTLAASTVASAGSIRISLAASISA